MDIFIFDGEGVDDNDDSLMAVLRQPWTRHSYDLTIRVPSIQQSICPAALTSGFPAYHCSPKNRINPLKGRER